MVLVSYNRHAHEQMDAVLTQAAVCPRHVLKRIRRNGSYVVPVKNMYMLGMLEHLTYPHLECPTPPSFCAWGSQLR